jgi:diguanylate cyclase (GGDEF)-like protein
MDNKKPNVEEYLPLMLGIVGAIGVFPFAIIRFMNGDYRMALLDAVLVMLLGSLSFFLYKSHRVRVVSLSLALIAIAGMLATIYLKGASQVYWIYPVLVGVFFLVERREALIASILAVAALIPFLATEFTAFALTRILITISVTCSLAYAFATITRGQRDELMNLATRDPLTGVGNRRAMQQKLDEVIASRSRNNRNCCLLMLDLDHFKKVNDLHGHAKGDEILIKLTEIIEIRIRATDNIYRIGGEEFVIVIEDQNLENASRLAEQLRTIVEANELAPESSVTISIGVAQHVRGESVESWMNRADNALYAAKDSGRNQTQHAA